MSSLQHEDIASLSPGQVRVYEKPAGENGFHESNGKEHPPAWSASGKFAFRTFFVYILILCFPTNPEWYANLLHYDWLHPHWNMLYAIAASGPRAQFITIETISGRWGIASYANLLTGLLIATAVASIWTLFDKKRKSYHVLYYWITVLARYQVGFSLILWGYRKLIPMQMIWPPGGILNTPFINMQEQKLYWLSVGIVPAYQVFLGFAEFLCGSLLLFRKTATLGGALTLSVLGNIALANHAFDGGVHIPSFTYALVGAFILWQDLPDILRLILKESDVKPFHYYPSFSLPWQKYARIVAKTIAIVFFTGFGLLLHWLNDNHNYRIPAGKPLANTPGYYDVSEFRLNGEIIPYSPQDSVRWQDAIFEEWATFSFKVNRKLTMDQSNGPALKKGGGVVGDIDRGWELAGVQGRHFYLYTADTLHQILHLQNKNGKHRDLVQTFHYSQPSPGRIILNGVNEYSDSIYVVLNKRPREYAVEASRSGGSRLIFTKY